MINPRYERACFRVLGIVGVCCGAMMVLTSFVDMIVLEEERVAVNPPGVHPFLQELSGFIMFFNDFIRGA